MKKMSAVLIVAIMLVVGIGSVASANIITVGDAFDAGSWAQGFRLWYGTFDKMEAFMMSSGDAFEPTGFQNFEPLPSGVWTGSLIRPDYIIATGSDTYDIHFDIHFAGVKENNPLQLLFLAWNDSILQLSVLFDWNGVNSWSQSQYIGDVDNLNRSSSVPEPSTLLLLGSGLIGLGFFRRKRIKS